MQNERRIITTHKNGDRQPEIEAQGYPSPGGAETEYHVRDDQFSAMLFFSNPYIPGITNEALLAIVIDRLEGFEAGPNPCEENKIALDHCRLALAALAKRAVGKKE